MLMRLTKLAVLLPLAAMAMFLTLGCGNGDEETKKPGEKGKGGPPAKKTPPKETPPETAPAPTGQVDQTDANAVAKAFVEALAAKDLAKTLALVHPDQRDELKGEFEKEGFPPIPDDPKVTVKVTEAGGVKTGKFQGNVRAIRNLGLKFDQGKWWVVD